MMKFSFNRIEDASGVSGVGLVAEGALFSNGKCSLCWLTDTSSIAIYESLDHVMQIHGHGGKTQLILESPSKPEMPIMIEQQEGGYLATTTWLPGCIAEGDNPMEALTDFLKAFNALVDTYKAEGKRVPWKKNKKLRNSEKV
jgi:predicted RNase H-like HicB family nuclease